MDFIHRLPPELSWAIYRCTIPYNGLRIQQSLLSGNAIMVSDASLKGNFGTSAVVIEGENSIGRSIAVNIVPGPIRDGDSYRCELAGIIGGLTILKAVCQVHSIQQGTIKVICDNVSTLRIFEPLFIPDPSEESFDLVSCLHHLSKELPITFTTEHVKGHALKYKHESQLTRYERLNEEMDNTAKAFWNYLHDIGHPMEATQMAIYNEGWTIWKSYQKIVGAPTDEIYPLLEDHHTLSYWTQPHTLQPSPRIPPEAIQHVDWEMSQSNMKALSLSRKLWTTKQASENCGVGITQFMWGKQDTDECPRCGSPEDSLHVLTCLGEGSSAQWDENIGKLKDYFKSSHTDPSISQAILQRLHHFRHQTHPPFLSASGLVLRAVMAQDTIGWKNFMEGLPAKHWKAAQARYYKLHFMHSRSSTKWLKGLLKRLHELAHGQWQHRNDTLYHPQKKQQQAARAMMEQEIINEYARGYADLHPRDHGYFHDPLMLLLDKSTDYLQCWIINITSARNRQARRRGEPHDISSMNPNRDKVLKWCKTRRFL